MTSLNKAMFETIFPCRYLTFTVPHPIKPDHLLRLAVLDTPNRPPESSDTRQVAALRVPRGRESDWTFSTESGHLQLLHSFVPPILRLILFSENNSGEPPDTSADELSPLFTLLSPKINDEDSRVHDVTVVEFEDKVVSSLVIERCRGEFVGEMLVEDVEIQLEQDDRSRGEANTTEFRRRLRFKRMPNLIQTEIRVVPGRKSAIDLHNLAYAVPLVAAISLIGDWIDYQTVNGFKPKALCLGIGGGALPSFLSSRLGFEVVGVEMDEEVVRVATEYFGLGESGVRVSIGEARRFVTNLSKETPSPNYDVLIVDLDCGNPSGHSSAPPPEFATEEFFMMAKAVLSGSGVVAVNVVAVHPQFLDYLIAESRKVFDELYKIDVGETEHVLVAKITSSLPSNKGEAGFIETLRDAISGKFMNSIERIN